jgi:uncharacterized membrane protein
MAAVRDLRRQFYDRRHYVVESPRIVRSDSHGGSPFLFLNLLLLLTISFLPFPTEVLGRNFQPGPGGQTAALFYAITCLAIALGFGGVYGYIATHPELVSPRFEGADFMAGAPWFLIGLAAYCVCIPLSFVSPPAVLALIAAVAVYYVFDHLPRPTS